MIITLKEERRFEPDMFLQEPPHILQKPIPLNFYGELGAHAILTNQGMILGTKPC
jgi:hypothetical protein